jgi:hypothetical protein
MMAKLVKPALFFAFALLAAWVIFAGWVHLSYAQNLPGEPDERVGRVYRMTINHGYVRYGTEREIHIRRAVDDFLPIIGTIFALAGLIGLFSGQFPIRKSKSESLS